MSNSNVGKLQKALKKNGYYMGAINNTYGEVTAQAVYQAKLYLGYSKPTNFAGDLLMSYLTGAKKPGLLMRQRAALRKKHHRNMGFKTLAQAVTYLGVKEDPPNSNDCYFTRLWKMVGQPWCAMFYSTCSHNAGSKTFQIGKFEAYCPTIVQTAQLNQQGLSVTHTPTSGCVVLYDWQHDGTSDHIGCYAEEADLRVLCPAALSKAITAFGKLGANDFWAIEGNTALDNDSNGGEVMLRKRNKSLVQVFVKVTK